MTKKKPDMNVLSNSMAQLAGSIASGVVPQGSPILRPTPNSVNEIDMLMNNVRGSFITLNRTLLSLLYSQYGIVQASIEVPVLDAFRGEIKVRGFEKDIFDENPYDKKKWLKYFTNEDDEPKKKPADNEKDQYDIDKEYMERRKQWEREQFQKDIERQTASEENFRREITKEEEARVMAYLRREQIWQKFQQALIWMRLFGGSGIVIMDGRNPESPLNLERINKYTNLDFYVADNWELSGSQTNTMLGTIDWLSEAPFYLMGHRIHRSRVLLFKGKEIPSMFRAVGRGWGLSVLESFVRTLNKNIKNENVIYELLDEAKMDIYKLNELNDSMLEEDSTEAVKKRLAYAQMIKNYMKALVLDTTDDYAQKQIHFSGLAELKEDARIDMAADTRIQITKLFGMTPAGFNSGDADRATYNDMVEAEIRFPCEPNMIRMLEVVGRKVLEKTLDWDFEWPELERMSKYDEAKMKTLDLANLNEANIWGRISNYEWTQAVNDKNLLNMTVSYKPEFIPDPLAKQVFKPGFGGGGK